MNTANPTPQPDKSIEEALLDSAFASTAQLHETLAKAGCVSVRKADYDAIVAENANHEAVRKECCELLSKIRDEVQKHEDEPAPKGFSWVRFCELGDRMSCLLRGIEID